jgi:hypothetical protein
MEKVAKFQPDMVKIRFAATSVANLSQFERPASSLRTGVVGTRKAAIAGIT